MRVFRIFAVILPLVVFVNSAFAEEWEKYDKPVPTKVVVRVLSHGAKAMGGRTGAVVVIRDARSGRELDKGSVQGGTGDDIALMEAGFQRITGKVGLVKGDKGMLFEDTKAGGHSFADMRNPVKPEDMKPVIYETMADSGRFETTLNITKPTQIIIEVYGPLIPTQSTASAVTSAWVFPGEDMTGEGIVMELRGLIVDSLASLRDKKIKVDDAKDGITVPFYMEMLCGCIIMPKGKSGIPWEAEEYKITTQAYYKGKLYYEDAQTSDKLYVAPSQFKTKIPLPKDLPAGDFKDERVKVRIMAFQSSQNNAGMDEFNVYLSR